MTKRKSERKYRSEDWMSRVRESSHDVVLAGLASLTRTHGADAKRAQSDFRTLVAEGRRLEPELRDVARKAWSDWVQRPSEIIGLQPQTRLNSVFDERVRAALDRLGVPSGVAMAELRAKVDRLLAREGPAGAPAATDQELEGPRARAAPRRRTAGARPADQRTGRRRGARG